MSKQNTDYDIAAAFERIENELIESMMRNLDHHRAEEDKLGFNWSQWQVEQLRALEEYKKRNAAKYGTQFKSINNTIDSLIKIYRKEGNTSQEVKILQAIKKGFIHKKQSERIVGEFIKLNDRKIDALINATKHDFEQAEIAMLRRANDQYRKIIYSAHIYANTGGTYEKAVDMATKDFLQAGINCIEYKNGSRHTMKDYVDMALRTAGKRAYLTGEGEKRKEWGIATVVMNKRGNPCPKCFPWVGKILIDDVWSGGSKDGKSSVTGVVYPLMSKAVAAGLYHPRCKDSHTTYFEGINTPPDGTYTKEELNKMAEEYRNEQKQQYAKSQADKYERMAKYSLDPENKRIYKTRADTWKNVAEKEASKKKYENENTIIFSEIINSNEYRDRIDTLDENIKTKRSIWDKAVEMLRHRSGTEYEDLAFINSKTGKTIINKSHNVAKEAKMNKKMRKMLKQSEANTIIAIHNHPNSSVPSLNDILCAKERKYKYGIVVGHNGKIFKYKIIGEIDCVNADFYLEKVNNIIYNNGKEIKQDKLNDAIEKLKTFGVELEVFL